jgi:endonuclease/exonuclease/phosphatase family metal-dependent hydrolase
VYLLQEVGQAELADLIPYIKELYEHRLVVHPCRSAQDRVALLVCKARLQIEQRHTLEMFVKDGEYKCHHYMSALLLTVQDVATGARVVVASAHFYKKKAEHLRGTAELSANLLRATPPPPKLVVWGGDCNEVDHAPFFGGNFCPAVQGCFAGGVQNTLSLKRED